MQNERLNFRDALYSNWHRRESTQRYLTWEQATQLSQIDLDVVIWVEYRDADREPVALIETARYVGQRRKPSTVTEKLAQRARLPALCVMYMPTLDDMDIARFYVRRICPRPEPSFRIMGPDAYAKLLWRMRSFGLDNNESFYG